MIEICNGGDDDCDGFTDEDFDLDSDKNNCGVCGSVCEIDHAIEACVLGVCNLLACEDGWYDDPDVPGADCDYECDFAGAEVCNGQDDDCDRSTDEGLVPPANYCNPNGECAGTEATCGGVDGWGCVYPGTVETDVDGNITPETLCDGLDNDCDGWVDEAHPTKDDVCFNGDGECRRFGVYACAVDPLDPVVCNAPRAADPGTETCNGLDDDCDLEIDEGIALDDMSAAYIDPPGAGAANAYWVFRYEASRPDATGADAGTDNNVACSEPNVLPWSDVTHVEAEAACDALNTDGISGWQLCDASDWRYTCERGAGWDFPYDASTYEPDTCNGNDYDCDAAAGDQDCLFATRSFADCRAVFGGGVGSIYDLSGNLKEWTADERPAGSGDYEIRGGSYNNVEPGLRCDFDFTLAAEGFSFPNLGFRCCNYP